MDRNIKKLVLFIILTFSVNWVIAALLAVSGIKLDSTAGLVVAIVYMFVPMTMAFMVQKNIYREKVKEPLGISFKLNKWFAAAWLLPVIMSLAAFGVSLLLPGINYSPGMEGMFDKYKNTLTPDQLQLMKEQIAAAPIHPMLINLPTVLIAGITVNAIAGFGEELGWRGFMQKELAYMGFWKSSAIIGIIWGIWHAPLILMGHNYPQHPVIGVFMMTLMCVLLGPIISYLRVKAKSVIAAAIAHGSFNASVGLAVIMIRGGNDLTIGMTGFAGIIVMCIVNVLIFVLDKGIHEQVWSGLENRSVPGE